MSQWWVCITFRASRFYPEVRCCEQATVQVTEIELTSNYRWDPVVHRSNQSGTQRLVLAISVVYCVIDKNRNTPSQALKCGLDNSSVLILMIIFEPAIKYLLLLLLVRKNRRAGNVYDGNPSQLEKANS